MTNKPLKDEYLHACYLQERSRCDHAVEDEAGRVKEGDALRGVLLRWDRFQDRQSEAVRGVSRGHQS